MSRTNSVFPLDAGRTMIRQAFVSAIRTLPLPGGVNLNKGLGLLLGICMCLLMANVLPPRAHATAYYIDNSATSGCSDTNAGTSSGAPWCDFTPVNTISSGAQFQPGDSINLRAGDTWTITSGINLAGTGTSSSWITVTSYNSGATPVISGNGSDGVYIMLLTNPDYWSISNLQIQDAGAGIIANYTTANHSGLLIRNIDTSGINGCDTEVAPGDHFCRDSSGDTLQATYHFNHSTGVDLIGHVTPASGTFAAQNIGIYNITASNDGAIVALESVHPSSLTAAYYAFYNVTLDDLYYSNGTTNQPACDSGLSIGETSNATIMDASIVDGGSCKSFEGTDDDFVFRVTGVNYINDMMLYVPETASGDETGFDFEGNTNSVSILNSDVTNNAGAGIEVLSIHGAGQSTYDALIADNRFVSNGSVASGCEGAVCQSGGDDQPTGPTGTIQDNLYDEPNGFSSLGTSSCCNQLGSWSQFTFTNNLSVTSSTNAAHDFGGTQGFRNWTYWIYSTGTGWQQMAFHSNLGGPNGEWTYGSNFLGEFEMFPSSGYEVAREWTAPSSGTVSVRGRVINPMGTNYGTTLPPATGEPLQVRIRHNGVQIWPASGWATVSGSDLLGASNNQVLDGISVSTGDTILFEVQEAGGDSNNPANDTVSWVPAIGYH